MVKSVTFILLAGVKHARLQPFMTLPTPTSVPYMQFQIPPTGTTPPVAEYKRVPRTSELQAPGTVPVTGNVSSQECLNLM